MIQKIKKGDTVVVMRGRERGKTGEVIKVLTDSNRVIVKNVNLVRKHVKAVPNVREGGIYEVEAPVHISDVMLLCPKCQKPTKASIRMVMEGDMLRRYRYCKKCKENIDLIREKARVRR
ncbi:MAG: 50S ribosomal protein L24 [Aquificaceae bacterium]